MAISFELFLNWAERRFQDVVVRGDEIMVNSIFTEDYKHHLSCNPSGGKHKLANGVYHCWKTDEGGSLVSLVMQVDKCTYEEALEALGGYDSELRELEARVNAIFLNKYAEPVEIKNTLALPENTTWIKDLAPNDFWRVEAEEYLKARKLDFNDYLICTGGQHKNRIIIPYFDIKGNLIYWNGRFIGQSDKIPKYLGPHKDCGVGKGDVIYMPTWPQKGAVVHITEGEFDAKSIFMAGLFSAAIGGKELSDKQIALLRPYNPVLCFDTDAGKKKDSGGDALVSVGNTLKREGFESVFYVRPPAGYKDWNNMLIQTSPKVIAAYINQHKKPYTASTGLELKLRGLGLKVDD